MPDNVQAIVLHAVEELNADLEQPVDLSNGSDAALYGEDGVLSSLSLVTLLISIEQDIEDQFDVTISLADDRAMSREHSPFRSLGALTEYASELVSEQS
jgi:acyl carrier protein